MPSGVYLRTEEHKRILSEAHKGKHLSEDIKRKISEANKGHPSNFKNHKHSEESKKKIRAANRGSGFKKGNIYCKNLIGKKQSLIHILRRSLKLRKRILVYCANCGKKIEIIPFLVKTQNNHFCNQKCYFESRGSYSLFGYGFGFTKSLRRQIRQRDNNKCQLCGVDRLELFSNLDVHHIDYQKSNSDPINLISLCCHCHRRTNHNREYWKSYFQKIMLESELEKRLKSRKGE